MTDQKGMDNRALRMARSARLVVDKVLIAGESLDQPVSEAEKQKLPAKFYDKRRRDIIFEVLLDILENYNVARRSILQRCLAPCIVEVLKDKLPEEVRMFIIGTCRALNINL
jgi:hypothetical protein